MFINEMNEELEIEYPTNWKYSVIGKEPLEVESAIRKIVAEYNYELEMGTVSKKGKYYSFRLSVTVNSEDERKEIFDKLKVSEVISVVI